jgi:hypothetical protein
VAGILAVYTLATIVCTWPLAAHLRTHIPAPSHPTTHDDALLLGWVLSWDVHQLLRAPLRLYEANLFHPLHHSLAYSEAMLSEALLVLPLAPLTPDPTLLYNVTLLSTFVLGRRGRFSSSTISRGARPRRSWRASCSPSRRTASGSSTA